MIQRTANVLLRWVGWLLCAWLLFFLARVIVEFARLHQAIPFGRIAVWLPYDLLTAALFAFIVAAMAIVPYAYVVWVKPERQFWGEHVPWPPWAAGAASIGCVAGLALGALGPLAAK
jgi:hypothetical protein